MGKKWITFDLDGTLMQNPFGKWVFPEIEEMFKEQMQGESFICEMVKEHQKRMHHGDIVSAYDWDDIMQCTAVNFGVTIRVRVEELVKKHASPSKVYLLEAGMLETLHSLKKKGYHLAAITNGYANYQLPVMDTLGLTSLFDAIITPERVGYGKPKTQMAASLYEGTNEIIAHIGDRIDHDVVFANRLGVLSVWIWRGMPETLKKVDPLERINVKPCWKACEKKWIQETEGKEMEHHALPVVVIHSIREIIQEGIV
jgi:putative hydrolase of the HAD superfamily